MGLWRKTRCPNCGHADALKWLWMVKCPAPGCRYYDPSAAGSSPAPRAASASAHVRAPEELSGSFDPGANTVTFDYTNANGQTRTYRGDSTTLRRRRGFFSLRMAPTGQRCTFRAARLADSAALSALCLDDDEKLTPVERQILGYHRKHGTSSPRLEAIRQKL